MDVDHKEQLDIETVLSDAELAAYGGSGESS